MAEREAGEKEDGECCEANGDYDGYDEYEEEKTYVFRRSTLIPNQEDQTQQHRLF